TSSTAGSLARSVSARHWTEPGDRRHAPPGRRVGLTRPARAAILRLFASPARARTVANEPELPRFRTADRRTGREDPGAAPCEPWPGVQHRGRDRDAAGQAEDQDRRDLPQPHAVAGCPAFASSGAALHARLPRRDL